MEDRAERFKTKTRALNDQFRTWVTSEVEAKPEKLLSAGCADYMRHSAKLRFQYEDIFDERDDTDDARLSGGTRKPSATLLGLAPLVQTKIVHFIRHGEGFHNIGIVNLDSKLTKKGWAQAHALGKHVRSQVHGIALVISSPLSRALETAVGVFGDPQGDSCLMTEQGDIHNEQTRHDAASCAPGIRYIVHESCRERLGPSNCDARRDKALLEQHFVGFDFSKVSEGPDSMWKEGNVESEASVAGRGMAFLQFVMSQPEQNIAIVSHSAFLWFTLAAFGGDYSKKVREKMQKWFENGEMRSLVLTDGGNLNPIDPYGFEGGEAATEPQQALIDEK
ncbi:hypothetical protein M9434_001309 [Picochlorum sp. BPE23]|nr:hypothetical protein M9434_001309 [Picochlorum sp. BPE23]